MTPESLATNVLALLQNDAEREALGRRALEVMQTQQGATERTVAALMKLLPIESHPYRCGSFRREASVNPLSALYGAGVGLRNRLYDNGTLRTHKLQGPVVSIGSISAGGAGKTPFLIMLGELLKQRGIAFDVLSRGYGRKSKGVKLVDPAGSPQEFGDEPLLIARKLGVPVIVGEDRYAAGQFAEAKFGPQAHLLDDGFQHRRLARDFDIALITERDLNDTLLPSGRLREPLSSLTRASALAFVHDGGAAQMPGTGDQHRWSVLRGIVAPETSELVLRVLRNCPADELLYRTRQGRSPRGGYACVSRSSCLHRDRRRVAV